MDIDILLQPHIQDFILKNENADVQQLALKGNLYPQIPLPLMIQQIAGRQKAKTKLPTFYQTAHIVYPASLSLEQCSSEQTALFKAKLLKGKYLVDLTGGFGIDAYFLSKSFAKVDYVEQNEVLACIAQHNFKVLKADNVHIHINQAETFLQNLSEKVDCIYLDPARRDRANRKVFLLEDCEPNLLELAEILLEKAQCVLVKTSPMLDIDLAVKSLQGKVQKIIVLAIENECKEVLYLLGITNEKLLIETVNLAKNETQYFSFEKEVESSLSNRYSLPQSYLYEPNVAVLKAGGFKSIAYYFQLSKLHTHSHLYTSNHLVENFAGRAFEVQAVCQLDKKELLAYLPENKANIAVRNFPMTVEQIRKKTGIKEGGEMYLFATTDYQEKKIVIVCKKINASSNLTI
ncbi:class I SAM-dependent methyltransferase [Thermoflexibacter ruber]|uniref:Putative SAM-dependent methyltransferase n=1 Tax=Thermoflexibacter ruber TaxID=1003 RepID=A0A1I2D4P0_9BACT|nr:class I SAM-dependent methyltransferase [Thermoflexibacter ruber]SFE75471.1 Putative SAM-dependent methyltransferase [Thermoflexibacter ruber]